MSAEKTERQLHLLMHLLTAKDVVSWENIKTDVRGYQDGNETACHRKFERDKQELREAGFEIETCFHHFYGENAGYRLKPPSFSFKLPALSAEERNLLFLMSRLFRQTRTSSAFFPFAPELSFSFMKLKSLAGGAEADEAAGGLNTRASSPERFFMVPKSSQSESGKVSGFLREIHAAIQKQKKISFLYHSPKSGKPEKRVVRPYVLYCRQGVWYAAGYSEERKGDRIFRLSRMESLSVNAKNPSRADYEIPENFNLRKLLFKETYQVGKGDSVSVRVRFSEEMAWLAQRDFAPYVRVSESKSPDKLFSFEIKNMKAFARKLLPYREHVKKVQPEELKECMKRELLTMREKYKYAEVKDAAVTA